MQRKANGTVLWVSLVVKELMEAMSLEVLQVLDEVPIELKDVYRRMMEQIKRLQHQRPDFCRHILSIVIAAYRPLHLQELHVLLGSHAQGQNVNQFIVPIVKMCGSFLTIRDYNVYIIHQSAKEFLTEEASHYIFPRGVGDVHHSIFLKSLDTLSRTLRRDIYALHELGYSIEQGKPPHPDPLAASRYSCVHWVDHICDWNSSITDDQVDLKDGGIVDEFLRTKYLYWLEALSLSRSVPKGVIAMGRLEALVQERADRLTLLELVRDARRFIMYHKQAIEISPLQAYVSALIISPLDSLIRHQFKEEEPKWITIKPGIGERWSACLQTLEGHSDGVNSVAFSHDSTRIASASWDRTVKIWDARSSACLQTLEVGKELFNISFDVTGSYLYTEIGNVTIDTQSTSNEILGGVERHNPQYQGVGLSANGEWITWNSENLVWLPSEYRPSCSAVSGGTIGIGVGSGKVWIFTLNVTDFGHSKK